MTREEFINIAKGFGYGYSDKDIEECFDAWDDMREILPGVTQRMMTAMLHGVSTEEEWLDYCLDNILVHY